jgi:hypothetical protein
MRQLSDSSRNEARSENRLNMHGLVSQTKVKPIDGLHARVVVRIVSNILSEKNKSVKRESL